MSSKKPQKANKTEPNKIDQEQTVELDKKSVRQLLVRELRTLHSGPLPPPSVLKEYNEALPDAAERIFCMAEKAQEHSLAMENKLIQSEIKKVSKGQTYALTIAIIGIIAAALCGYLDQAYLGAFIGGSTLIQLIPHFLFRPSKKEKDENNTPLLQESERAEGQDQRKQLNRQ